MIQPKPGDKAPDFRLTDQNGKEHSLSDYRGKKVLLYFYPKDDTPGCTVEACSFRDSLPRFASNNLIVLGISADDEASHKKFAEKFSLPFPLLADTEKEAIHAYGVWKEKMNFGKAMLGIKRESFLIDENGIITKHYENVDPKTHAVEVEKTINF